MSGGWKKRSGRRPEGKVRRSQLLTGGGPGALVDLIDYAVIMKGLNSWSDGDPRHLDEPRLANKVLGSLRRTGYPYNHVRLRLPPRCKDDDPHPAAGVRAREFPFWFVCSSCQSVVTRNELDDRRRHTCTDNPKRRPAQAIPLRFLAACAHGHLQDIPWVAFAHRYDRDEQAPEGAYCVEDPELRHLYSPKGYRYNGSLQLISTGASGDLAELLVRCRRCGATRGLQDLTAPHGLGPCRGRSPWLPPKFPVTSCEEPLRLITRTASSAYFAHTRSALSIPDSTSALAALVTRHRDDIEEMPTAEILGDQLRYNKTLRNAFRGHSNQAIFAELQAQLKGTRALKPLRELEWQAFLAAAGGTGHEVPPKAQEWFARRLLDIPGGCPDWLDRIVLVGALREVRAQVGFSRLEPEVLGAEGADDGGGGHRAPLAWWDDPERPVDWVPAVEIKGEGIFVALNEDAVRAWEALPAVQARADRFRNGLSAENEARGQTTPFGGARLLLLHSLAHMLITQISLACGYSASAIRERLYCYRDPHDPTQSRAGLLLYTGTPGSEGTLGGLVEVGRDLMPHLRRAAQQAMLCSNDPICAQHLPDDEDAGRPREGAACHGCLYIAEPSCERMNRDLDRAMVVPTLACQDAAFLRGWLGG